MNNAVVENLRDDLGGHEILEEEDVDNDAIQEDHPLVSSVIVPVLSGKALTHVIAQVTMGEILRRIIRNFAVCMLF